MVISSSIYPLTGKSISIVLFGCVSMVDALKQHQKKKFEKYWLYAIGLQKGRKHG